LADINHPLEGILGGGMHLGGTLERPRLTGGLVVVDGRIGEADLDRWTLELVPSAEGYQLDSDFVFTGDGALGVHGFLPLDLAKLDLKQPGLDIGISGAGIPLSMAAGPSALRDPAGLIALEGQLTGTLASPHPALALKTEGAGFTVAQAGLRYSPVDIDIGFTPEGLDIRRFEMRVKPFWSTKPEDGSMSLRGTVGLEAGELTEVDLSAEMSEFWLASIKLATLAVSGKIDIGGTYPDLNITGELAADEARFEVSESDLTQASGLEIDSNILVHRDGEVQAPAPPAEEGPSLTDAFNVDLKLDLQQRMNLKAEIPLSKDLGKQFSQLAAFSVELTLDGDLAIEQRRGALEVAGEVVPVRGFLEVLGKRFELQEGRIVFIGADYDNPVLDLSASHQVGQYGAVDIKITGTANAPSIAFSSREYPDQTDVMSMLLFGKPTSAMSETEGETGSGLLTAALSSVGGQAARSSGASFLQNVSVDPGSGSVKVGFPLSDRVYLAVERLQPESETDNMTQASVEWILSRRTYAELITGDQGKSSGDLYWRWRF
jgi:autotransporter translocation and assembly factor TamB